MLKKIKQLFLIISIIMCSSCSNNLAISSGYDGRTRSFSTNDIRIGFKLNKKVYDLNSEDITFTLNFGRSESFKNEKKYDVIVYHNGKEGTYPIYESYTKKYRNVIEKYSYDSEFFTTDNYLYHSTDELFPQVVYSHQEDYTISKENFLKLFPSNFTYMKFTIALVYEQYSNKWIYRPDEVEVFFEYLTDTQVEFHV